MSKQTWTHFDAAGNACMVDVSDKPVSERTATARGSIRVSPDVLAQVKAGSNKKGDVLGVAQLAAIMGAKKTSDLIPLCHPLPLTKVSVTCDVDEHASAIVIEATVKTTGRTGVEMEALTAVQVGLLTVYDMCKAVDKSMVIGETYLVEKTGGTHGHFKRTEE